MSAYSQEIFDYDDDDSFPALSQQPVAGPSGANRADSKASSSKMMYSRSSTISLKEKDVSDCSRVLSEVFGHSKFKGKQKEIVEAAFEGQDVLVVAPTGMGKSLCFQIPAIADERGLSLVVAPLLALMQDQVESLRQKGIEVASLNSQLKPSETEQILKKLRMRDSPIKLLYITPERMVTEAFLNVLQEIYQNSNLNRLVVDEAHCISEWGHNFRAEYRQLGKFRARYPDVPIMALTATATEAVRKDIIRSLKLNQNRLFFALHPFNRSNLFYEVRYLSNPQPLNQMADIFDYITTLYRRRGKSSSGIVYCRKRQTCDDLAGFLRGKGLNAKPYHRGISSATLETTLKGWTHGIVGEPGSVDLVVATIAFGMGIDKADVRYIIHYDLPKSLEGFYQETGRAGRDGLPSKCILYYSREDAIRVKQFACTGNPHRIRDEDEDGPSPTQRASGSFDALVAFAETSAVCRHVSICRYFGEDIDETDPQMLLKYCNNMCDICKYPEKTNIRTLKLSNKSNAAANVPSGNYTKSNVNNYIHQHGPPNPSDSGFQVGENGRLSRNPSLGLHKRNGDDLSDPFPKKTKVTVAPRPFVTRAFGSASGLSKPFKAPTFVQKDTRNLTTPIEPTKPPPMMPEPPQGRPTNKDKSPPAQIPKNTTRPSVPRQLHVEIVDYESSDEIIIEEGEISPPLDLPLVDRLWKAEHSTKVSEGERKDCFESLRRSLHRTFMPSFGSDDYWGKIQTDIIDETKRNDIIFRAATELENSAISLSSTKNGYIGRIGNFREEIKNMKDLALWDREREDLEDIQEVIEVVRQCSRSPSRKK